MGSEKSAAATAEMVTDANGYATRGAVPLAALSRRHVIAARALLGWSQSVLAEKAGVGRGTVAAYESGKRKPQARHRIAIVGALKTAGISFSAGGVVSVVLRPSADALAEVKLLRGDAPRRRTVVPFLP
jgi:DNA-binding XRE family transcriptional regulator